MAPHIVIIGAGIAGLALGQGLKKAGIPFSIFERDTAAFARQQGYRLRVNNIGGTALKETLLTSEMWSLFQTTSANLSFGFIGLDPLTGSVISRTGGYNPNIPGPPAGSFMFFNCDRTTLRATLMHGLEAHLTFGKELSHYTLLDGGLVEVTFSDGSTVNGSLLVGADGVNSRVRRQYLPNHSFYDTEGRIFYGKTPMTPELLASFPEQGLECIATATDSRPVTLFLEPVRFKHTPQTPLVPNSIPTIPDYVYWVLVANRNTFAIPDEQLLRTPQAELPAMIDSITADWSPSIKSLFDHQSKQNLSFMRVATAQPSVTPWTPTATVTLLGDAIHVMSPAGGQGANTALHNAALLCQAITKGVEGGGITAEDIGGFEKAMLEHAGQAINGSIMPGKKIFNMKAFEECQPIKYD